MFMLTLLDLCEEIGGSKDDYSTVIETVKFFLHKEKV